MSLDRANLRGSAAKITWNGVDLHTGNDFSVAFAPTWGDVVSAMYGVVDRVETDRVATMSFRLFGNWESLSVLFPSAVLTPTIGRRIFGTTDLPLVVHAKNNDRFTFHNAQITKLANLYLGLDNEIFSADVEFTALIKNNANPEDANAYFTIDTAAYSDSFSKANYKRQRYGASWSGVTGFTAFQAKEGFTIDWTMALQAERSANLGTVDFILTNFAGTARGIPVEPTNAQIATAAAMQGSALGRLLSASSADLAITGSGVAVTLKNAGISRHGFAFGSKPLRNGEITWETTQGFSAGVQQARAVIA
jgi:hypothetical protein